MTKLLSTLAALAVLITSVPVASAEGEGVHPWDVRARRKAGHINPYRYHTWEEIYLSPERSKTSALHPYHRRHAFDRIVYDYIPGHGRSSIVRFTGSETGTQHPLCGNYQFRRPNKRFPPYAFECQ